MTPDRAAEGHMTPDELATWVDDLRADQGLPRRIENPTTLAHVSDLMRAADDRSTAA